MAGDAGRPVRAAASAAAVGRAAACRRRAGRAVRARRARAAALAAVEPAVALASPDNPSDPFILSKDLIQRVCVCVCFVHWNRCSIIKYKSSERVLDTINPNISNV